MGGNTQSSLINIPASSWKSPVAAFGNLPATGNTNGDARISLFDDSIYVWNGSSWVGVAGPAGPGGSWKQPVTNHSNLPSVGNNPGDVRVVLVDRNAWEWDGSAWFLIGPINEPLGQIVYGTGLGTTSSVNLRYYPSVGSVQINGASDNNGYLLSDGTTRTAYFTLGSGPVILLGAQTDTQLEFIVNGIVQMGFYQSAQNYGGYFILGTSGSGQGLGFRNSAGGFNISIIDSLGRIGANKAIPAASVDAVSYIETIGDITSFGAVLYQSNNSTTVGFSPLPDGTGVSYVLYANDSIRGLFSSTSGVATGTATIQFEATAPSSTQVDGSGNYTANGSNNFLYTIFSIDSTGFRSIGNVTSNFSDNNDGQPFSVQLNWTPPGGTFAPNDYLVWNSTTGTAQYVGSNNPTIIDDGTWSVFSDPGAFLLSFIVGGYSNPANTTNVYIYSNVNAGTVNLAQGPGGQSAFFDDNTLWGGFATPAPQSITAPAIQSNGIGIFKNELGGPETPVKVYAAFGFNGNIQEWYDGSSILKAVLDYSGEFSLYGISASNSITAGNSIQAPTIRPTSVLDLGSAAGISPSTVAVLDSASHLISTAVTTTEIGYVSGVTSAIQTQLNAKAASGANSDITSLSAVTQLTRAAGTEVHGTNTNNNATAGYVGEYLSSSVVSGSAVTLTTATPLTVTSMSVPAGDWDISGVVCINGTITGTQFIAAIGQTTNSLTGTVAGDTQVSTPFMATAASDNCLIIPAVRKSLASTTTIYLLAQDTFTIGTAKAYGRISARRVR